MTRRTRMNVYFDPALMSQVEALALRPNVSKSAVIEAAVASLPPGLLLVARVGPTNASVKVSAQARRVMRNGRQPRVAAPLASGGVGLCGTPIVKGFVL